MTIHNSLAELIGNTPLVKLNHIPQAAGVKATIAVKVEYFNPGGSSKDRIAERIIDAAEQSGQLKPGGVIVEPTSGNTGVGLALVAQQRGYRTIFTLPDKVSESKRALLLSGRRTTGQYDSRRLPPEPVRQSERPAEPLLHHRT